MAPHLKLKNTKITIFDRAKEFENEEIYVFDKIKKIMMCGICNCVVKWERKSVIDYHCISESHKTKKKLMNEKKRKQISIQDSFEQSKKNKTDKEKFILSTVSAFIKANIPLEKLDDPGIRDWMNKYIKGSGDLPSVDWIRKHYVPLVKDEFEEKLKETIKDKPVIIHCDETTDRKGQAVFITLLKILPNEFCAESKLVVAGVTVLSTCNAPQCSQAIMKTLTKYDVQYDCVKAIASDSAPYMTSCVNTLKGIINSDLIHIQCWSHKLDKVTKICPEKFIRLNEFVSKTKKLFKNTRKRKYRYMEYLKKKYCKNKKKDPKLFPLPVMTRWGSWKRSSDYVDEYGDDIAEYAKTVSDDVKAVKYFKKLSSDDIQIVKTEASFVKNNCTEVSDALLLVEGSKYAMAHNLYPNIQMLKSSFDSIIRAKKISVVLAKETNTLLQSLSEEKRKNVEYRMRKVAKISSEKIGELIDKDPAKTFFQAAENLFYPVRVMSNDDRSVIAAKNDTIFFNDIPDSQFLTVYSIFKDSLKNCMAKEPKPKEDPVSKILMGMLANHSQIAIRCLQVISMSVSNVDVERAFSAYADIVSPKRCNLLPVNAETMLSMYFGADLD